MGTLIAGIAAVIAAVTSVAAAVAATIAVILAVVVSAMAAVATIIASVVAGAVVGMANAVGLISFKGMLVSLNAIGLYNTVAITTAFTVMQSVAFVVSLWSTFAGIIHLKTLLSLHEIANLLSINYRIFTRDLFTNISELSHAIGLGAGFIPLALRNARAIVLDASTALGRPYDMAELTYLSTLSDWTAKVSEHAKYYETNPYLIFEDLDTAIIKPAMDTKGSTFRVIYTTIDAIVETSKMVVDNAVELKHDLERFVDDLPTFVKDQIGSSLKDVLKPFDNFIRDDYAPAIAAIDGVMFVIDKRLDDQRAIAKGLIEQLKHPVDMLYTIDDLPEKARDIAHTRLYLLTNRTALKMADATETAVSDHMEQLKVLSKALAVTMPAPAWDVPELSGLIMPISEQDDDSTTWFVGDD